MAFNKELPEWKAAGIEPPLTKRNEGWRPGEKPPADWLNWTQNRTYEALKELQEKSAEITSIQSLSVKSDVRVGTTENITLSGTQTINGIAVIAEDRILVKNQNTGSQNGIYVVKAGAWARAADADTSAKLANGIEVFVREGTVGRQTLWRMTNTSTVTLGSTALIFQQTEAPLISPAFTGMPTAPTATAGSNNTQIATTSYVDSVVSTSPAATPLNLSYGHQIVTVPRNTPYNLLNITGRTLINLLGRDGNFESIPTGWGQFQASTAIYTTSKAYGSNSLKITIAAGSGEFGAYGSIVHNVPVKSGSYYIVVGEFRNLSASGAMLKFNGIYSDTITDATKFATAYLKTIAATTGNLSLEIVVAGAVDQIALADGIRVYELSATEYASISGMTTAQIAAKYPYVDDVRSIVNPYVIKQGENLLPPFTEWTANDTYTYKVEPYRIDFTVSNLFDFGLFKHVDVLPNQQYTFSVNREGTNGAVRINYINRDGTFIGTSVYYRQDSVIQFTTPSNAVQIMIFLSNEVAANTITNGTFTFNNPMLNLGSTALPFKPKADDYLLFPNVQLASNVDNTIYDTLSKRDGRYWKLSYFKAIDLDGSRIYDITNHFTGFKRIRINLGVSTIHSNNGLVDSFSAVKYDGKILTKHVDVIDGAGLDSNGLFYMDISSTDTGWGDNYSPSYAEVQAYFYGWKMSATNTASPAPYNGMGSRYWFQVGTAPLSSAAYTFADATPTTAIAAVKPYKLQYQLATPIVEEITLEGDITLHEGLNQLEVGNGMIVREKTNPYKYDNGYQLINNLIAPSSLLGYRPGKLISVYRNNLIERRVTVDPNDINRYGNYSLSIAPTNYDQSAAYTITYLALDQYSLTSNVQSIQGEYASNLKTIVDTLATNQATMATRVGVLENTKSQKAQPQYIKPALLNGSTYFRGGYYKDGTGRVYVDMGIAGGSVTEGTALMQFPKGYEPAFDLLISFFSSTTGEPTAASIIEGKIKIVNGLMILYKGANGYMHFSFSFMTK